MSIIIIRYRPSGEQQGREKLMSVGDDRVALGAQIRHTLGAL